MRTTIFTMMLSFSFYALYNFENVGVSDAKDVNNCVPTFKKFL